MSRKRAIDAMCKSCIYDPIGGSGTWRQQVEACTAKHCPLYEYRPKSSSGADESESEGSDGG